MSNATHAAVITKPGHDTVRFGPLLPSMAGEWRLRLEHALTGTARAEGTAITAEPYDPEAAGGYINPASIPASAAEVMEPPRAGTGRTGRGAGFPGLCTRLVMRHGHTRGDLLRAQACHLADEEAEASQAEQGIQKEIAAAQAAITEGLASAGQALRSLQSAEA